jgi:hypothetical protein
VAIRQRKAFPPQNRKMSGLRGRTSTRCWPSNVAPRRRGSYHPRARRDRGREVLGGLGWRRAGAASRGSGAAGVVASGPGQEQGLASAPCRRGLAARGPLPGRCSQITLAPATDPRKRPYSLCGRSLCDEPARPLFGPGLALDRLVGLSSHARRAHDVRRHAVRSQPLGIVIARQLPLGY